jgi:predicted GNAT family acetyltransferase
MDSSEVRFVNINLETDCKYFVDPFKIARCSDPMCYKLREKIIDFYKDFLHDVQSGKGNHYLDAFHEVKPIRFGYAKDSFGGKGVGKDLSRKIIDSIKHSKAYQTGYVRDIEDWTIFIKQVSSDRVSDLISNIIVDDLIIFTQNFCNENNIPMISCGNVNGEMIMHFDTKRKLLERTTDLLPYDHKMRPIILVPNFIVKKNSVSLKDSNDFYKMGILEHIMKEKSLFETMTDTQYPKKVQKNQTDELVKAKFVTPTPGSIEFAVYYLNNYDENMESISIYKQYRSKQNKKT